MSRLDARLVRSRRGFGQGKLLAGWLGGVALAAILAPSPAAAQFVCGGSATGAEPQGGGGAGATAAGSVACGTSALAGTTNSTAVGNHANVSGGGERHRHWRRP